jgi:hypothetical protein
VSAGGGLVLLDTPALVHIIREDPVGRRMVDEQHLKSRPERPLACIVTHGELLALARK